jgi:hypothetical protein
MRIEEVESTHSPVRDNHLAGREVAAVEALEELAGEEEVEASDVVGDHVDPIEGGEAQDRALVFLPLSPRTSCLGRDRLTEELVETSLHFGEDHRCLGHVEAGHLSPQVRGGVGIFLRRTCDVSIIFLGYRIGGLVLLLQGQMCLFHRVDLLPDHLHLVYLLCHWKGQYTPCFELLPRDSLTRMLIVGTCPSLVLELLPDAIEQLVQTSIAAARGRTQTTVWVVHCHMRE